MVVFQRDSLTFAWVGTGVATVLLPLTVWGIQRLIYFARFGSEKYMEDQQRNWNNQNNYWGSYYGNGNNYGNQRVYENCSWLNFPCRRRQWLYATGGGYNQYNNYQGREQNVPGWYIFLGGTSKEMQQWQEQNGEAQGNSFVYGGLGFAYFLTVCLFGWLVVYGASSFAKPEPVNIRPLMLATTIFGLMNMIMSVGLISSDQDDLKDSYFGWYGQMGVLMVYTNFLIFVYGLGFYVAFGCQSRRAKRRGLKQNRLDEEKAGASYTQPDYREKFDTSVVVN